MTDTCINCQNIQPFLEQLTGRDMPSISSQLTTLIQIINHLHFRTRLAQQNADVIAILQANAFGEFIPRSPSPDILMSLAPPPSGTLEPVMRHQLLRKASQRCMRESGAVTASETVPEECSKTPIMLSPSAVKALEEGWASDSESGSEDNNKDQ